MSFQPCLVGLSHKDFKERIKEYDLVLIEFRADWSGGSHIVEPIIRRLADIYKEKLPLYSVDADRNQEIIKYFEIWRYPTMLLMRHGKMVDKIIGMLPLQEITYTYS